MIDLIQTINDLRDVARTDARWRVRKVVVVLSAPRSGSSLVKRVLAAHPDIASMDGEIEPLLALTRNGFGHRSASDAVSEVANRDELADNVIDALTVPAEVPTPPEQLAGRWEKRLLLQFPCLFSTAPAHARLLGALDEALAGQAAGRYRDEQALQAGTLAAVFRDDPRRINCYDGFLDPAADVVFDEPVKIEEPPFVVPALYRRPLAPYELETKTLLFKTPPDVYRIGMYEQIFPCAEVSYIHLTRGYAQTVNGLMDGWLSPVGFFSHDLGGLGRPLDIEGYSDRVAFGRRWWKFDLPPNWPAFVAADLETVCLNQWMSAHQAVLDSGVRALRVAFEAFVAAPSAVLRTITDHLGLRPLEAPPSLPVVMAIEPPRQARWQKRAHLLALGERPQVRAMMGELGYRMDPGTWQ